MSESSRGSPPRVLTATALFDGHDAAINLVRRLLQDRGVEVVHLGHNRSVAQIVTACVQEDVHAVAVSSYQGGHNEFFPYLRSELDAAGAPHVVIFGGGGGVVLPAEVERLESSGVRKIFTPEDGRALGLDGMGDAMLTDTRAVAEKLAWPPSILPSTARNAWIARALSAVESGVPVADVVAAVEAAAVGASDGLASDGSGSESSADPGPEPAVLGVTGPGGAGKSSLVDEIVLRFRRDRPDVAIAVLSVDPTRRRTGGALLGDRLRMNAIYAPGVFVRSFATRGSGVELSSAVRGSVDVLARFGFRLVIVETAGIGQGSAGVLDVATASLYVMTPEFGAPTQLEKIDMLDFAEFVAVNKVERPSGLDAVIAVQRQLRRLGRPETADRTFGTSASAFNDPGVDALFDAIRAWSEQAGAESGREATRPSEPRGGRTRESNHPVVVPTRIIPLGRESYLAEAAAAVRAYHAETARVSGAIRDLEAARRTRDALDDDPSTTLDALIETLETALPEGAREEFDAWQRVRGDYEADDLAYEVGGKTIRVPLTIETLSGTRLPRVSLPRLESDADIYRFLREENLPGRFPYTAGVFPLRRRDELATRQFAGEGPPERTNRRFHLLCEGQSARRLSVAFDSVTLYGHDPDERPDIWGKVGESGVSIATWEDMARLFRGFDLCDPATSVSMTINGPAPAILAMFFVAAIEDRRERFRADTGREPTEAERAELRATTLGTLRGTVQADILKEDQAQNTCLFSTAFSIKAMGDVQQFFTENGVRNFYSVSISGYHIAEAGANPITQLAFTLANGLTYVEYYLSRGMSVDEFARNFSFFFSMGMDPEYSVLGRVARRVWAIVLRDRYGAGERARKLKYHVQTSGRSLHAREMAFNDIRTTLQALAAYYDRCSSLHTNAYDEALTTPTEQSVRRAVAIQLIVAKELGTAQSDNALQGSHFISELTDLVEEAVLAEFERISARGGIPGAMGSGYLRSKIQEESRIYEERKHSGALEIIGVNTFLADDAHARAAPPPVVRATAEEKDSQIEKLRDFQRRHAADASPALERLKRTVATGGNTFETLMDTVRFASLGQITQALFEVGGEYRRTM